MFLEILQNSLENTCAKVSFLIKRLPDIHIIAGKKNLILAILLLLKILSTTAQQTFICLFWCLYC